MAKKNNPIAPVAPVVAVVPALDTHVDAIKDAYVKRESFNAKIGKAIIDAAAVLAEDQIESFLGMVKTAVLASGAVSEGSFKVELTRMRGVIRAIVLSGFEPAKGASLRAMYDAIPKTGVGGAPKKGAKLPDGGKAEKPAGAIVTLSAAEKRALDINAAITTLFGTCTPDLIAAMEYATANSGLFMSWTTASAKAAKAQQIELALEAQTQLAKVAKAKGKAKKPATTK